MFKAVDLAQSVLFGLVSHWRWHMQKEEGLAQGYPLGKTE